MSTDDFQGSREIQEEFGRGFFLFIMSLADYYN